MHRFVGSLFCLSMLIGCEGHSPLATPPGLLLDLGPNALGDHAADRGGDDQPFTERIARCSVHDPDGDLLFSLDVTGHTREADLIGLRISARASECVIDARLAEAQTHPPAGDVPAVARVSVTYRCARYRGAGFIEVAAHASPTSQSFGFRCSGATARDGRM